MPSIEQCLIDGGYLSEEISESGFTNQYVKSNCHHGDTRTYIMTALETTDENSGAEVICGIWDNSLYDSFDYFIEIDI